MTSPAPTLRMSEDEYFAMLEKSVLKYEYWDGVAVAMAGAQTDHITVRGNIFGELFRKLEGTLCLPRGSDQAVKLAGARGYVFPDISVLCGAPEFLSNRGISCLANPVLIVEVLSPSTAYRDENDKLFAYTGMRTVREYLVVSTNRYGVKLFSRQGPDELWSVGLFAALTDTVTLESCGCALTLAQMYKGVELSEPEDDRV